MKRKLLSLIVGTALVLSTAATAMAAEPANIPEGEGMAATATVSSVAASEVKDGVFVNIPQSDDMESKEGGKIMSGIISMDDMKQIVEGLDWTAEEKAELSKQFVDLKAAQDKVAELSKGMEGADEAGQKAIIEKIIAATDAIDADARSVFKGDVLDKAVELGFIQELKVTFLLNQGNAEQTVSTTIMVKAK